MEPTNEIVPPREFRETITYDAWMAEGRRRFGPDTSRWAFVCPSCGHVATVRDWKNAGAVEGEIAFSCVGRRTGGGEAFRKGQGPCTYAGGGLFAINPVRVIDGESKHDVFAFADVSPEGAPYAGPNDGIE